jgi:5'(3')-deoxyribonucleotidase
MDQVIVNLNKGWLATYNELYDDNMKEEELFIDWAIHKRVKCGTEIYKILATPMFARMLEPIDGAIDSVMRVSEKYDTFIISSASRSGQFCLEKHLWLENYLPKFDLRRLILCHPKWMIRGDILIDDRLKNIKKWKQFNPGGCGILMAASTNKNETKGFDIKVSSWKEITDYLLKKRKF